MSVPAGKYFIDGKDFWTIYSIIVEEGSDDFLKYPSKKDSITRDWPDADGKDVDLSKIFFNSREISLKCALIAKTTDEFWDKYEGFIAQWAQPGVHRVQVGQFGLRSFYCYYNDTTIFQSLKPITIEGERMWLCKFTLNIIEGEPNLNKSAVFIIDEENRFLIT